MSKETKEKLIAINPPEKQLEEIAVLEQVQKVDLAIQNLLKDSQEDFKICQSIYGNIVKFPGNKKFRKIKMKNKILKKVWKAKGSKAVLRFGGFVVEKPEKTRFLIFPDSGNVDELALKLKILQQIEKTVTDLANVNLSNLLTLWKDLLCQGDKIKKGRFGVYALYFYQKSANVIENFGKVLPQWKMWVCLSHSYETCGNFFAGRQLVKKSIEYFEKSVENSAKVLNNPNTSYLTIAWDNEWFKTLIYSSYISLSKHLLLVYRNPQEQRQHYLRIFELMKTAWGFCQTLDNRHKYECALFLSGMYSRAGNQVESKKWASLSIQYAPRQNLGSGIAERNNAVAVLLDCEQTICSENAVAKIAGLYDAAERNLNLNPEFAACLYGQLIYYHTKRFTTIKSEDGVKYGQKGLDILRPKYGEKHDIVRNIYISMTMIYTEIGEKEKARFYDAKRRNSDRLLKQVL